MKKRYLLSAAGTIGASAVAGYLLKDKKIRTRIKDKLEAFTDRIMTDSTTKNHTILEDAGIPDQVENQNHAQMENAKMVSEGSQYGVNYFNEVKEEEYMKLKDGE